ncbi:related to non-ribosomal peptide synthetase [Armillaria ostoyae]|uniref:Related to non-ribosomal peptide synthetase n=1 Tax=Armillaria ostoyae TaxID=47428 RepID=A0A284RG53_ARMOS|nr:related to non-ribosomal peptide synthetase [Armillaria ostoyae]
MDPNTHTVELTHSASTSTSSLPNTPTETVVVHHSSEKSTETVTALDAEKQVNPWDGYEEDEMPEKKQPRLVRNLRLQAFSIYRRLFSVVFLTNIGIFISYAIRGYHSQKIALVAVANIFIAILMRQEHVINALFAVTAARVYHNGGVHSGAAVSGTVWLILLAVQATRELVQGKGTSVATVSLTYIVLAFLVGIVVFAYPTFRIKRHDAFERMHRFMGWTATALVWSQVVVLTNDYKGDKSLGHALVHSAPFWLMMVLSWSLILPWTKLQKVPVRSVVLSNHAVRPHPVPGSFQRFSTDPLNEWHSFATIAAPGVTGYSIIISQAGDWTTEMITNPPKEIWVRGIPTCGALRIVPLFRRVLFVATGSGIAPFTPHILSGKIEHKLFWMAPNTRATFGDPLVDDILAASPGAVVYDTRKHGKPDIVKLTNRMVDDYKPECVCVISNQKLTEKVIYGLRSRGILAFGAIFDS